jgi:hypothetical protein
MEFQFLLVLATRPTKAKRPIAQPPCLYQQLTVISGQRYIVSRQEFNL